MATLIKAFPILEMAIPVKAVFHNLSEYSPMLDKIGMKTQVEWSDGTISEGIKHCGCAYLVQDGGKNILVDTGCGSVDKIKKIRDSRGDKYYLKEIKPLEQYLCENGISLRDIDIVINTHLHWDHCGGNELFNTSKFFIPQDDIPYAITVPCWAPHFFPGMEKCTTSIAKNAVMVKDSIKVTDNVQIIWLGGHTPGSLGVLISTEERGIVALPGDVVCKYENLEYDWIGPGGNIWNVSEMVNSVSMLRNTCDLIIPSHDWRIFDHFNDGLISKC